MTRLRIIFLIGLREFTEHTRTRVFRVSTVLTILTVVAAVVAPTLFEGKSEIQTYKLGLVNQNPQLVSEIITQVGTELNLKIEQQNYFDEATALRKLESKDVDLVVVPEKEIVVRQTPTDAIHSGEYDLGVALSNRIKLVSSLGKAGVSGDKLNAVLTAPALDIRGLNENQTRNEKGVQASASGMILLFVFLTLYGAFVLNSVIEEKTSRVVEILLSSVRPIDLLTGKVFGIGLVGSVQAGVLVVATTVARSLTPGASQQSLTLEVLGYTILWFALGFMLYSGLYACAGALVSRSADAQSLVLPLQVPLIASYVAGMISVSAGQSVALEVMSLIPFTAPITMLARMSANQAPLWQILLSITLILGTSVFVMRLAVVIFAGGILRVGQRVKLRDAWRNPMA